MKQALLFVNKKKQKNFDSCGLWHCRCQIPQDKKFFGSFFKKEPLAF